ncbi:MAG: branched-chain amino acid ABC transporter permease [Candidatus Woesearchaeota archaeon]|nr:branched-chain amino acid ABC transporter permease [Candidatus Woesearchaeota archaeon]
MGYFEHLGILICIYVILSASLNIILGFTGMLNLGHVAFFGIGAYTSALLAKVLGFSWLASLAGGVVLAGVAGLLIGIPCLRLRGDYLAIATLGFGEIVRSLMKNWSSLTRGPLGIPGIPKPELFGFRFTDTQDFLILAIVVTSIVVFLIHRIVHSPFGRVLRAIREDEIAAQSLGKNVVRYKLFALTIGAAFAGVAGSLYAHYITFIDPTTFSFFETVLMVAMVVLGGMGSLAGSIIGAIILVILPEPLRFIKLPTDIMAALRDIIYSVILILMMHFRPNGLVSEGSLRKKILHWWHRVRGVSA